jgi:hypothetical protein
MSVLGEHNFYSLTVGAIDGLKLCLQASGNSKIQGRYYNGWTHDRLCILFFAFVLTEQLQLHFNVPDHAR